MTLFSTSILFSIYYKILLVRPVAPITIGLILKVYRYRLNFSIQLLAVDDYHIFSNPMDISIIKYFFSTLLQKTISDLLSLRGVKVSTLVFHQISPHQISLE